MTERRRATHRRPERVKNLSSRSYEILAALLLADGGWIMRQDLAAGLFDRPTWRSVISRHIWALVLAGGVAIERHRRLGVRLTTLPPDEHLDLMLGQVPAVRRSRWWLDRETSRAAQRSAMEQLYGARPPAGWDDHRQSRQAVVAGLTGVQCSWTLSATTVWWG